MYLNLSKFIRVTVSVIQPKVSLVTILLLCLQKESCQNKLCIFSLVYIFIALSTLCVRGLSFNSAFSFLPIVRLSTYSSCYCQNTQQKTSFPLSNPLFRSRYQGVPAYLLCYRWGCQCASRRLSLCLTRARQCLHFVISSVFVGAASAASCAVPGRVRPSHGFQLQSSPQKFFTGTVDITCFVV